VTNNMPRLAVPSRRQGVHDRIQKTGSKDASPGGTFITARRFLGRNLETLKNSVERRGFHAI